MSVAAWKRIAVGTSVEVTVKGASPEAVAGKVLSSSAATFLVLGHDDAGRSVSRRFHWPPAPDVTFDGDRQLRWRVRGAEYLLTITAAPETEEN